MFKRAAVFYLVLCGCALHASAQSIYTTAIAITPDGSGLSPGAPVQGTGYHVYSIDSSLKLVLHGVTLGPVGANFSVVNGGDLLDSSHFVPASLSLNGYQLTLDQPFLIGMHLSYLQVMTVTQERFGWARLKYTPTGLQILDQATALGGNGIIAGTTTFFQNHRRFR